jgi:hypothetical protein
MRIDSSCGTGGKNIQTDISAPAPLSMPIMCQAQLDVYMKALEEEELSSLNEK